VVRRLTLDDAWKIVSCIENVLKRKNSKKIFSAVVYGSLLRGDFIPGISDIDLLIVFKREADIEYINRLQEAIWKCSENYRGEAHFEKIVDILWIYKDGLPLKNTDVVSPFKCLSIYAFDFVKYSKVLFGVDFRKDLKVPDPKKMVKTRAKRLLELLEKFTREKKYNMVEILAGEAIRLAQICYGEATIDKRLVFRNFMKYVPDYSYKRLAEKIWSRYLTKHKKPLTQEELEKYVSFIKETVALVLTQQ